MDFNNEIDTQGAVCPIPALKTKKALKKMKNGEILKVVTDYGPAAESIPRDLAKTSHKYLETEFDDFEEVWSLYFECVK